MKMNIQDLTSLVYNRKILSIDWPHFSRTIVITIDGTPGFQLRLQGVHYCSMRQSLLGPETCPDPDGFEIYGFDLSQEHPFLDQWLQKKILFAGEKNIYDSAGAKHGSKSFRSPSYMYLVISQGMLDVIFETWEVDFVEDKELLT